MVGTSLLSLLVLVVAPVLAQNAPKCNADNCYRQVLGTTRTQSASNVADCRSRLVCTSTSTQVTVTTTVTTSPTTTTTTTTTPATTTTVTNTTPGTQTSSVLITVTTTVTPVTTITVSTFPSFAKRFVTQVAKRQAQVCPNSALPSYASSCGNFARYSSACSCAGVVASTVTVANATPTVTSTSTVTKTQTAILTSGAAQPTTTLTSTAPTITMTVTTTVATSTLTSPTSTVLTTTSRALPTLCGNSGMGWGAWEDFRGQEGDNERIAYDPTTKKQQVPDNSGVTRSGTYRAETGKVYDQNAVDPGYILINQRGYLYVAETGKYTFTFTNVDDVLVFWFGNQAYSGWDNSNRNAFTTYLTSTDQTGSATYITQVLPGGTYQPFRFVYHNGGGPGSFDFRLTAPSGRVIFDSTPVTGSEAEVVQFSCPVEGQQQVAPPFPAFGAET